MIDLETVRHRLREWAAVYKDRPQFRRAGSAEGNWRSPQVWSGVKPRPVFDLLRAEATWRLLQQIEVASYRAITWRYCYGSLPQYIALRSLSRRVGRRVSPKDYDDLVYAGERQVAILLAVRRPEAAAA